MDTVIQLLRELERQRFYGSLEIKLEAGRITLLRKTETLKPAADNCRNNRGTKDEQRR